MSELPPPRPLVPQEISPVHDRLLHSLEGVDESLARAYREHSAAILAAIFSAKLALERAELDIAFGRFRQPLRIPEDR